MDLAIADTPCFSGDWPDPPVSSRDIEGNPFLQMAIDHGQLADDPGIAGWPPLEFSDPDHGFEILRRFSNTEPLKKYFSWAIPSDDALRKLAELAPLVEVGAGGGYWASLLRARGVDVRAFDPDPPPATGRTTGQSHKLWTEVERADAATYAASSSKSLLICWPPMGERSCWDYEAVARFQGDTVAFVGELSGCTGSAQLFNHLSTSFVLLERVHIPSFMAITDDLFIFERSH